MPSSPPLAEAFARIVATLLAMVGARLERPGRPGLAGPMTLAIANRLQRLAHRLHRLVARWQAGTLTPPRPRNTAPRRRAAPAPGPWDRLPRGRAWLARLVPGSSVGASHLRRLLDDPDMQALLAAAPQAGRTLRPLWHMLCNDPLPPALQRPRPAARPARAESGTPNANPAQPAPAGPPPTPPPAPEVAAHACAPPLPA